MVCKKDKEREKAAEYIVEESRKMSAMFLRLSHACNPKVCVPLLCGCMESGQDTLVLLNDSGCGKAFNKDTSLI